METVSYTLRSGWPEYREIAEQLQKLLLRIKAAGEPEMTILPIHYHA